MKGGSLFSFFSLRSEKKEFQASLLFYITA